MLNNGRREMSPFAKKKNLFRCQKQTSASEKKMGVRWTSKQDLGSGIYVETLDKIEPFLLLVSYSCIESIQIEYSRSIRQSSPFFTEQVLPICVLRNGNTIFQHFQPCLPQLERTLTRSLSMLVRPAFYTSRCVFLCDLYHPHSDFILQCLNLN
jgi:hypothetical protein